MKQQKRLTEMGSYSAR